MTRGNFTKFLGVDYGRKRIGLAAGGIFPFGMGVLDAAKGEDFILSQIKQICIEEHVGGIVVGLPVRSQGEPGTLDEEIRKFAQSLSDETRLPVYLQPEQFSSFDAKELLGLGKKMSKRASGEIDETAAILILEQFLLELERSSGVTPDFRPD